MANSESSLVWNPLKKELDKLGLDYCRLEDKSSPGIPDLNIHSTNFNCDLWVEMKYLIEPKNLNSMVRIGLRKEQYIWLRRALHHGRSVFLLARIGTRWFLWTDEVSFLMARDSVAWKDIFKKARIYSNPADLVKNEF